MFVVIANTTCMALEHSRDSSVGLMWGDLCDSDDADICDGDWWYWNVCRWESSRASGSISRTR